VLKTPPLTLLAVILLAIAVRVAACMVWSDDLTRDRDVYLGIAQNVAAGSGFCSPGSTAPTAYRPPLYPLLLAIPLLIMSPAVAVAVVNVLAGVVMVCAVWGITRRMGRSSIAPALIIAIDPLLVRYTAQPMTECVFAALTAGLLWALAAAMATDCKRRWMIAGVVFGLAALCRPTIWPFALVVGVIAVWRTSIVPSPPSAGERVRERGQALQIAPLSLALAPHQNVGRGDNTSGSLAVSRFLLGIAITVALWVIRNAIELHRPILTTTHGGYTLLLANNPVFYNEVARQPWGAVWSGESLDRWQQAMLAEAAAELGPSPGEIATDRWQAAQARQNIRRDPGGFAAAVWYRLRSFWSLSPRGEDANGNWICWLIAIWYAVLLLAAACGVVLNWSRDARWTALLLLLIVIVQAVHLIYWTDTRMRAPLHPVFALLIPTLRRTDVLAPRQ